MAQLFGKKCQKNRKGDFLTHTVHAKDLAKDVTSQRSNNTWTDWAFGET